jgi:hypothetical protein
MNEPLIPDESHLPDSQKKKIVNQLLFDTFHKFFHVFHSLGYKEKILGRWTNEATGEAFQIEFKKVEPNHQFGL